MTATTQTIFAVSSGSPPAAIGVIRVSGPSAGQALCALTGRDIAPRRASLAKLRSKRGDVLDEALVLWFPGPATATGEDLAELHCHGGRAVLAAVCAELATMQGLRPAQEGEFTRRAFANGRLDLAEAEGLADLLEAETELQRAAAIASAGGALSGQVEAWRDTVLRLSAQIEAALDFSDEDDVSGVPASFAADVSALAAHICDWLDRPRSERLKDGFRVVLGGPPNCGKSTLFNALVESEAAITSPIAGTTRDVIERSVAIAGVPFVFIDTAGLRDEGAEEIEAIGISRAQGEFARADLVLWLGSEGKGPCGAWEIAARSDSPDFVAKDRADYTISAKANTGVSELKQALVEYARGRLPKPGETALNARQHARLQEAHEALSFIASMDDLLLIGEELRRARLAFDQLIGRSTTEDMLDALFGRFCIGK
ncbi:tRNA uridine-5-carboxymethylaminomethyl(34) synthesis GTPase MnmE [Erythrobacter sp. SCSIO 43205]|uniref:tRNA uridine-5-carboxymethylaminomethyl(34) synthesis GTPase MnmE n=1 Tax=Erythrobacter sp. SCSIO 43205 TaxID=2779361 RepID=UPI001CA7E5CC|nr:tRNA uridine-5-carboxymethylaminomethyl(34) synthesis GTPase MnmE [Erythrobacter sp. SCSIO 43205]UAB78477.1 tRNA uridine-5-carboxymethylaminomethyl(34) synthesis GTPase MnmE [Erythrobacter sp. SCSIO 43205]